MTIRRQRPWYRNHTFRDQPDYGAWYFASSPEAAPSGESGRFDLPHPMGTCYLGSSPEAALRELVGPDVVSRGWVEEPLVEGRVVSALRLPHQVRAADVSHERASDHRVSNELTSMSDYSVTQAWARILHKAGFRGIRYALRFTPGSPRGLALFGRAGAPDPPWFGDPHPEVARDRAAAMGLTVVPIPARTSMRLIRPRVGPVGGRRPRPLP